MAFEARYKGKELAVVDEDEELSQAEEASLVPEGSFRLMDLPAELRVYIYQFLLPYNKVIRFHVNPHSTVKRIHPITNAPEWSPTWQVEISSSRTRMGPVLARQLGLQHSVVGRVGRYSSIKTSNAISLARKNEVQTQLFLVNKEIFKEARGTSPSIILYFSVTNSPPQRFSTAPTPTNSTSPATPTSPFRSSLPRSSAPLVHRSTSPYSANSAASTSKYPSATPPTGLSSASAHVSSTSSPCSRSTPTTRTCAPCCRN